MSLLSFSLRFLALLSFFLFVFPLVNASKIVEKCVRFPSLSDYETADSAGTRVQGCAHHAGYYYLPRTRNARMFYFLFESRKKNAKAPVVVWLSGGPGCSGSVALFYENGPFQLTNNLSLVPNEYGWDKESNILYLDQPLGTGFSYTTNRSNIPTTSEAAAVDFYDFLQAFFQRHPELANNDFYMTGESYAGHFIPVFAARIQQGNKNNLGRHINLKGLAIGNGMTNAGIQYKAYPDYALNMKLINRTFYNYLMRHQVRKCERLLPKACDGTNSSACTEAYNICFLIKYDILESNEGLNPLDIRKQCTGGTCYDFSNVYLFLNKTSVKNALGVGDTPFVLCNPGIFAKMSGDVMRNLAVYIPELLDDGINLLVYAGEYDFIYNWLGNWRWVADMVWYGQKDYKSARNVTFKVDSVEAGLLKSYGPLTFLKMFNAGLHVPMDQPKASLEMLRKWILK